MLYAIMQAAGPTTFEFGPCTALLNQTVGRAQKWENHMTASDPSAFSKILFTWMIFHQANGRQLYSESSMDGVVLFLLFAKYGCSKIKRHLPV